MELSTRVTDLPFIGPIYARRLARLEIHTLGDLLYHFPHRYDDFSVISEIARVQPGETVTIHGRILSIKNEYTKRSKVLQRAVVEDETGKIEVVWFNQRYLVRTIPPGTSVSLSGKITWFGNKLVMESPEYEKINHQTIHTGRLVPIYPETSSVSSKWLRTRIAQLLTVAKVEEFLPSEIINSYDLSEIKQAFTQIHFPKTMEDADKARLRFSFEELFLLQLSVLERKHNWSKQKVCWKLSIPHKEISLFIAKLPFELTRAQKRVIEEILASITQRVPMNRLLEGDVGSGKTVVAAIGAFVVAKNGFQTAVMAPTQILAQQHYQTLSQLLEPEGISVGIVTSDTKKQKGDVIVGTHALLHQKAKFDRLAFVVIDEQHKFGVEQRATLLEKVTGTCFPHVLTMTATPIPRTVALTLYGDLDLSVLDELPAGRQKITTWLVPPQKREGAYNWIREQIKAGSQAFIVCPLIEESEVESMKSVKAATVEFAKLAKVVFPELTLGLLHGRLKATEKEKEIGKFRNGATHILVSTPVVEVGIDIPNATIMMVEGADRFGLAQLHQLRGRVGRGEKKSYCLLFTESVSERVIGRLHAMEEAKTGPELAELDLRLRGPGELFGTAQHGFPELKVASFSDLPLIKKTKDAAEGIFPKLKKYPKLASRLKTRLVVPN
ncbi:ATP-dependent DNA helicase RecG [Candidatus Microgenomates bacterium]|nr:ATP-dependent DNA helicase RecG [Candidatus Microgenomates bacterium]